MTAIEAIVSVVLPTYNERDNIGSLISAILENVRCPTQIIVVDDDSPDRTWQVVEEIRAENDNIELVRRIGRRGLASAIAEGISLSRGEVIVWMDCDFSMPPEVIPRLVEALGDGYDIAIGSRYVEGGKDGRESFTRVLTSKLINLFACLILGFSIKDYTTGFVAARREVFDQVNISERYEHGEYCIDFLYKAKRKGFKVKEIPYVCRPRRSGETKTASNILSLIRHGARYCLTVLKLRFQRG
jgi:dolichol-phosphate mannosyltransferase